MKTRRSNAVSIALAFALISSAAPTTRGIALSHAAEPDANVADTQAVDTRAQPPAANAETPGVEAPALAATTAQSDASVTSRVVMQVSGGRFLDFSPDGDTLAAAGGSALSWMRGDLLDADKTKPGVEIKTWSAKTDKTTSSRLQTEGTAGRLAWSPDLKRVAVSIYPDRRGAATKGAGVCVWNAATGKLIRLLTHDTSALYYGGNSLAWSPDGKTLAASFDGSDARLYDVATGKRLYQWYPEDRGAEASVVAFSPNGWNLAVGRVNTKISIHDTRSGEQWRILERNGCIRRLAFSRDSSLLASGAGMWTPVNGADKPWEERGGETQIWDMRNGNLLRTLPEPERFLRALAWSSDNRYIATVTYDDEKHGNSATDVIKIWDAQHAKLLKTIPDESGVQALVLPPAAKPGAPEGSITFATITTAGDVKLWSVQGLEVVP